MSINDAPQNISEIESLLTQALNSPPKRISKSEPTWIFGAGNFAQDLSRVLLNHGYCVAGFVETRPTKTIQNNLPVVSFDDLSQNDRLNQLAIGIFNRTAPINELHGLASAVGFKEIFTPMDIYEQLGEHLGWRFWLSSREVIAGALPAIKEAYQLLEDEVSKATLLGILSFRLGVDLSYAQFMHDDNQYFNDLTLSQLRGKEIKYVDLGAYNGDTFLELKSITEVVCKEAYLFEPDPGNFSQLVKNVKDIEGPICLPLAASDTYKILTFSAGQGESGNISSDGDIHIAAASLDEILPSLKVDLLKLDIEGAEMEALNGAARCIQSSQPIITLSLYHKPQDLWALTLHLKKLCPKHKLFIRQHYFNSFDSVLYAVPSN